MNPDPLDELVSRRLSKLRQLPMDTAAFDAKLKARIGAPRVGAWRMPALRAIAATLLLGLSVSVGYYAFSPGPVLATPQALADIYQTTVSREGHVTPIRTIDEARRVLRSKWPGAPLVPAKPDDATLMHCCVHAIGRAQMACVTFQLEGQTLTLASAAADEVRSPGGQTRDFDTRRFHVSTADGIAMVMTEQQGVWTCLMGPLPVDRLLAIADAILDGEH